MQGTWRSAERRSAGRSKWRAALLASAAVVPVGTAASYGWVHRSPPAERTHLPAPKPSFERTFEAVHFLKGNVHTHTSESDGDAAPEDVIAWYRRQGYAFIAITDHNRWTVADRFSALEDGSFRLIDGEEVSMNGGGRQVHVNALCARNRIGGGTFSSAAEALAWATTRIASEGGVAVVNHPNFDKAVEATDLLAAGAASLIEIMSGHPYVYSQGIADRPSHEAMWDYALSAGAHLMGIAVDDVHHLRVDADPPAFAGRGWIQVFGERNEPGAICDALRQGLLYASTGAEIRRISVTETTYSVWPADAGATVHFIGRSGRSLEDSAPLGDGEAATYLLRGGEGYVRANVVGTSGAFAWTPAVFEHRVIQPSEGM